MEDHEFIIQKIRRDYPEHANTEETDAEMQSLIHTYQTLYNIAFIFIAEESQSSATALAVSNYFEMLTSKFSEKRLRSQVTTLALQVSSLQERLDALEKKMENK